MHLQVAIDEPQKNPAHGGFKYRIVPQPRRIPASAKRHERSPGWSKPSAADSSPQPSRRPYPSFCGK
jgi:hypothetical protein